MSVEPQTLARRKLAAAARIAARALPPSLPAAFFITDPVRTPVPEEIAGGLPMGWGVVYRHFGAPDRGDIARRLASICQTRGLAFLIAADPDLALETGAEGVHWPFRMRRRARHWRGQFGIQTMSAHSGRELRAAAAEPVCAVILSTVFASDSPSAGQPMGALKLRMLAKRCPLPVYALGGVTAGNAGAAASAGGFAAVGGMAPFRASASEFEG